MLLLFILLRADRNRLPDIISLLSLIRKTRFSFLTVARFLFSFMGRVIFLSYTGGARVFILFHGCVRFRVIRPRVFSELRKRIKFLIGIKKCIEYILKMSDKSAFTVQAIQELTTRFFVSVKEKIKL